MCVVGVPQMSGQLLHWFIVFCVVLAAFSSAEYVAYGYIDSTSYTWIWGFIARFIGAPSRFPRLRLLRLVSGGRGVGATRRVGLCRRVHWVARRV